ncbi:insulinase family protein [Candidatus Woesearchaeota archaeon]|nr:insulinase family protein [Candidatus Woesearchaeota archaeon]
MDDTKFIDYIEKRVVENTRVIRLENGLTIVLEKENNSSGVLNGLLDVKFGSVNEQEGDEGIAHFLEHMCFSGTRKYPNRKEIIKAANRIGMYLNASTDLVTMSFPFRALKDDLKPTIDLMTQLAFDQTFPEGEIERERANVLNELRRNLSNPYYLISGWSNGLFIRGFSQGHSGIGTEETIGKINTAKIVNYRNRFMIPNNAYIGIVGNINDKMIEKLERITSSFKRGEEVRTVEVPDEEVITKRQVNEMLFYGISRAYVKCYFRVPRIGHEDLAPLAYASEILIASNTERLNEMLRERHGLTYGIGGSLDVGIYNSGLVLCFDVEPKEVQKSIEIVEHEIERLRENLVAEEEIVSAIKSTKIRLLSKFYDGGSAASLVLARERFGIDHIREMRRTFRVNREDVRRVAQKYLGLESSMINIAYPA